LKKKFEKKFKKKFEKNFKKKFEKMFEKKFAKKVRKYYKLSEGGREGKGGWRIVIPMPEAINFVDRRRQKTRLTKITSVDLYTRVHKAISICTQG
jgi:hypothetical protein